MRAYLERIEPQSRMARFYVVQVVPTLLGQWAVQREWGRIGQAGTVREGVYAENDEAQRIAFSLIQAKVRRGYRRRPGIQSLSPNSQPIETMQASARMMMRSEGTAIPLK